MTDGKILVTHISESDADEAIRKIKKVNEKSGPFDLIIVYSVSCDEIAKINTDGLPQLLIITSHENDNISESKKISETVTVLYNFGTYRLANGITISYLTYSSEILQEQKDTILDNFDKIDSQVDILVTKEWGIPISDRFGRLSGNDMIDELAKKLQARYHFAFSDEENFFELEPFKLNNDRLSRFLNIPKYGSGKKWAYAFKMSVGDNDDEEEPEPTNLIANPYTNITKRSNKRSLDTETEGLVEQSHNPPSNGKKSETKKIRTILPTNCHFCFSNPNLEDHMIISIGKLVYLTTAKGPLSVPKGDMDMSGHCLIIPIEHIPKLDPIKNAELSQSILAYESSLVKMNYIKFDMCTIVFEIQSERSIHFHKQVVPIPKYLVLKFNAALDRQVHFNNEKFTRNAKLDFQCYDSYSSKEYSDVINNQSNNYLQFTIYETPQSNPKIYLATFNASETIDLQFGRRVLAFLLNLPRRVKWNSPTCLQTKQQESAETEKFQKAYKDYDISLVES
ncbi:YGR093W [Saccharomyces arboricola H-6]|uniref:YGR093W n=1 Tax=Saccharomyces arboricola (strain H-6 / AS 2.3317 / CBS 10644) TaxID=1160507 RepID=J8PNJ8_SACAR|nr:YGR093W [Saccharomyces arboricola H-6]